MIISSHSKLEIVSNFSSKSGLSIFLNRNSLMSDSSLDVLEEQDQLMLTDTNISMDMMILMGYSNTISILSSEHELNNIIVIENKKYFDY